MEAVKVYDYLDYRAFLNDLFVYKKQTNKHFSYRAFAGKAGFTSPSFIKLVMNGERNLTNKSVAKVSNGFGLKKQERDFFENLVFMNQATSHDEKNRYYKKMMSIKGYTNIYKVEKASYDYFSKWYYPVIREIVTMGKGKLAPDEIADVLNPKITPQQAVKAIFHIEELGLISRGANGGWEQANKDISTSPEVKSLVVTTFHKEMIRLGSEAIERHEAAKRDISAVTMTVKSDVISEIKKKVDTFRKELLEFSCDNQSANQVMQINIQIFPLTDAIKED